MSRIHEALLRAEQERAQNEDSRVLPLIISDAFATGSPVDEPVAAPNTAANILDPAVEFQSHSWTPDQNKMVFLDPQRFEAEIEVFRKLRSKMYSERSRRHLKTVLVTSASTGDGKSFIAANLAFAIAHQQSETILLVDADQRRPVLHNYLGTSNVLGLSEYLQGQCDLRAVIQRWADSALHFVPAGRQTSKPAELLTSGRMQQFLQEATHYFDWIILDSPPYTAVADGITLAENSDGVLLVVGHGAGVEPPQKLVKELRDKPILGAVLNRAEVKRDQYRYSLYGRTDSR